MKKFEFIFVCCWFFFSITIQHWV